MSNPSKRPSDAVLEEQQVEAPRYQYDNDASVPQFRPLADPSPLGFFCFGLPTFLLSLITLGAAHVHTPNIVIGLGTLSPRSTDTD